jgi:hypothetical protein
MLNPRKVLQITSTTLCCAMVLASYAQSDSIELRDGRHLHGKYLGGTSTAVGFMTDRAVEYFPTSSVLVLVFEPSGIEERSSNFGPHPATKRGPRVARRSTLQRVTLRTPIQ